MNKQIILNIKEPLIDELFARSDKMVRNEAPLKLNGAMRSIQFLRGVFSRVTFCLPAFYYFLGSESIRESTKSPKDYPLVVACSYAQFSALNTMSLSCRKLFDNSTKNDLTGSNFSKVTDSHLAEHARYWGDISKNNTNDCMRALKFIQRFFSECSKSNTQLLKSGSPLQRRVGLIKQHADRAAAHLSLDNYSISFHDLAHFTAACTYIAEIIRKFDMPSSIDSYFNDLDKASYQAAKHVFPDINKIQLFSKVNIARQAMLHLEAGPEVGVKMLLNNLHRSIGGPALE